MTQKEYEEQRATQLKPSQDLYTIAEYTEKRGCTRQNLYLLKKKNIIQIIKHGKYSYVKES